MSAKYDETHIRRAYFQQQLMYRAHALCESAIEREFLLAIHEHRARKDGRMQFALSLREPLRTHTQVCHCIPQFVIPAWWWFRGRRLDFLFVVQHKGRTRHYAIECDGEEYHSTQSGQAADRRRDAELAARGIYTFRVTGRSIKWNASAALNAVLQHIRDDCGLDLGCDNNPMEGTMGGKPGRDQRDRTKLWGANFFIRDEVWEVFRRAQGVFEAVVPSKSKASRKRWRDRK